MRRSAAKWRCWLSSRGGAGDWGDDVELPDATIAVSRVELDIAPASTPEREVTYSTQAELVEGRFSAMLDASSLTAGAHRVWARACLGDTCGASPVEVTL